MGVPHGCHLWVEWVYASLLDDQTEEFMESILGINLEKIRTDSINQKRKKKKKEAEEEREGLWEGERKSQLIFVVSGTVLCMYYLI